MNSNWYDMNCGEGMHITEGTDAARKVLRVPGGWIVTIIVANGGGSFSASSCFVPYVEEFKVEFDQYRRRIR